VLQKEESRFLLGSDLVLYYHNSLDLKAIVQGIDVGDVTRNCFAVGLLD
jgi:hypothetical protein